MLNVTLYSTNCPKCKVLKTKLNQKGIVYEEINDIDIMNKKGFEFVPKLDVDGIIYDFKEAVEWIGGQ
jgi:glutaredoxin